jgi:hypothetical protein
MKPVAMNRAGRIWVATAAVVAVAFATPAFSADTSGLPAEVTQGSLRYVSGGVGEQSAAAFKQAAATYPLELLFAQKSAPNDVYLASVKVTVRDRAGKVVLEAVSEGPYLLATMPPGKYQIDADHDGVSKRQAVEIVSGKHRRVVFVWAETAGVK